MQKFLWGYNINDVNEYIKGYKAHIELVKNNFKEQINDKKMERENIAIKIERLEKEKNRITIENEKYKRIFIEIIGFIDKLHRIYHDKDFINKNELFLKLHNSKEVLNGLILKNVNQRNTEESDNSKNVKFIDNDNFWGFDIYIEKNYLINNSIDNNEQFLNFHTKLEYKNSNFMFEKNDIKEILDGEFWEVGNKLKIVEEEDIEELNHFKNSDIFLGKNNINLENLDEEDYDNINLSELNKIRNKYICGNHSGIDIYDEYGKRIVLKNQLITNKVIKLAEEEGKLAELILNMVLPD